MVPRLQPAHSPRRLADQPHALVREAQVVAPGGGLLPREVAEDGHHRKEHRHALRMAGIDQRAALQAALSRARAFSASWEINDRFSLRGGN